MQFFHRGKPKSDGSRNHTNMHVLHTEDTQSTLGDLRYEIEDLETNAGFQRAQHHDVVKVGCIYGIMEKINLQE